ncbi:Hypothetical predicted protein [Paramuricea clavata]|uniref:Uncharacterized protein n=1 Tax=Paramuricea clavata TaxID=317549 RepID=A0A7D9JI84_PARCT|nr:Hypothetical predicted protein [Paramuricea clavata]
MLSRHKDDVKKRPKAEKGLSKSGSRTVLKETGVFLQVGSGVCSKCRKILADALEESKVIFQIKELTLDEVKDTSVPQAQSTPAAFDISLSSLETLQGTLYSPSNTGIATTITSQDSRAYSDANPIDKLNEFLQSKDVSPIRYPVKVPWEEASERTRRCHIRKAKQTVQAVLEEVAPIRPNICGSPLLNQCHQISRKTITLIRFS